MNDAEACFYVAMRSPQSSHDRLLRDLVTPIVREISGHPDLDSLFFVRYDQPSWELRFRVLGRPTWIEGNVRPRVVDALHDFEADGTIERTEIGTYAREWDRYGGPVGMRLAERIFLHDSLACLDLLQSESTAERPPGRREWSLAYTDDFLGLFGLDARRRLDVYREGHVWAFRDGVFRAEDRPRLERQYEKARAGLQAVLFGAASGTLRRYGSPTAAGIAERALAATRPIAADVLAGIETGTITQAIVPLVWSYTHMHCNRLGIEVVAEALLRYLAFRAYEERLGGAAC